MDKDRSLVRQLLRKKMDRALNGRDTAMLDILKATYSEAEWNALLLDVMDDWVREQNASTGSGSLVYWLTGVAAMITVAIIALIGKGDGDGDPNFPYADLRCAEIPMDEELALTGFPVRVSWGDREELRIQAGATGTVQRVGDIELRRKTSGELQLVRIPADDQAHPNNSLADQDSTALNIRTAAMEQAEVVLPGGTRIRLNAGSSLSYRPLKNLFGRHSVEICIIGEALVSVPPVSLDQAVSGGQDPEDPSDEHEQPTLHLATLNAEIQTAGASFSVLSLPGTTILTLLEGALTARSIPSGRTYKVSDLDKRYKLETIRKEGTLRPDRWGYRFLDQREEPAGWTRRVQSYHNMPMREFISEMGRWYGFRVERIECIPAHLRITVAVCRDTPLEDVLAVVHESGVPIYRVDGAYSFCKPPGSGAGQPEYPQSLGGPVADR